MSYNVSILRNTCEGIEGIFMDNDIPNLLNLILKCIFAIVVTVTRCYPLLGDTGLSRPNDRGVEVLIKRDGTLF